MTPGDVTTGQPSGGGVNAQQPQWSPAPNPTRRPILRTVLTIGVAASTFLLALLLLLTILGERLTAQTIEAAT